MKSKILPDYCVSGRKLEAVDGVVIHYFSGKGVDEGKDFELDVCRRLFLDLNRERRERAWYMKTDPWPIERMFASAHILIGRDGEVWKLVEFDRQAYHAGASLLNGRANCNRWTLGVELIGNQESGFSRAQYVALVKLLDDLQKAYGFSRENVSGHDTVRWAAIQAGIGNDKRPKYDPSGRRDGLGDNFDWWYLGKLWNDRTPNPEGVNTIADLDAVLAASEPIYDREGP